MNEQKKFYTSKTFAVFQIATFVLTILIGTQLAANESANEELIEAPDTIDEYSNAYGEAVNTDDC